MNIEHRLPLSSQHQLWCAFELSDAFHPRFTISRAVRVTGPVDVPALQAALDDVVARHEALRTIIVRDAQPPYQLVHPPSPVPLTVQDLPLPAESRQLAAENQLIEAEQSSIEVDQLPLLRAKLVRFDGTDSVLSLVSHHSACDGWSINLILRDLATCYQARAAGQPPSLPAVAQYQDYVRWQQASLDQPGTAAKQAYWREQLSGARIFTLPTDHPVPAVANPSYVRHSFGIDGEVATAVSRFASTERFSALMVTLAAFNVLAHRISGTYDPAVNTIYYGRSDPQFKDTVGVFMYFVTMRTDLTGCRSFRDVVTRTRATCLQAYENVLLQHQLMEANPALMEPLLDPYNSYCIFGYWDASLTVATGEPFQLGEAAYFVRTRSRVSEQLPGGAGWSMGMSPSGELTGGVQFSPQHFEEHKIAGWVSDYCRILAAAMADPDREWQALAVPSSPAELHDA